MLFQLTLGFSGADNVCNEAALLAACRGHEFAAEDDVGVGFGIRTSRCFEIAVWVLLLIRFPIVSTSGYSDLLPMPQMMDRIFIAFGGPAPTDVGCPQLHRSRQHLQVMSMLALMRSKVFVRLLLVLLLTVLWYVIAVFILDGSKFTSTALPKPEVL